MENHNKNKRRSKALNIFEGWIKNGTNEFAKDWKRTCKFKASG